jgi:WD40 repeat protein
MRAAARHVLTVCFAFGEFRVIEPSVFSPAITLLAIRRRRPARRRSRRGRNRFGRSGPGSQDSERRAQFAREDPAAIGAGDIQFRPDGVLIVASVHSGQGDQSHAVMAWDWRANRVLKARARSAVSATNVRLPGLFLAVSADGRRVALTGFVPDAVSIWDAQLTREVSRLPASGTTYVAFTADGRRIATAHPQNDPAVRIWDTETGQLLLTLTDADSHRGDIGFTADGRLIAGLISGGITIWETQRPKCAECPTRR